MKRSFRRQEESAERKPSVEPAVSLKAVLGNPRESLFPSFASLFEEAAPSGASASSSRDAACSRLIGSEEFVSLTSPEVQRLFRRFVANHAAGASGGGGESEAARAAQLARQLDAVPAGFFAGEFVLRQASPAFGHVAEAPTDASRAADQDALNGYLDVVEGQLAGQETGDSTSLQRGCFRSDSREERMARFEFVPRDGRSSKNEPKRVENDRATSLLKSWPTSHPCPAQASS